MDCWYEHFSDYWSLFTQWWAEHMFLMAPAMAKVAAFKGTFKEFPQRQKPGSFVP